MSSVMRKSSFIIPSSSSGESSSPIFHHLKKPISSSSSPSSSIASLPVEPDPPDDLSSHHLLSILSHPKWQRHPSFQKLIPNLSPSHVSSLFNNHPDLNPNIALQFFNSLPLIKPGFKHTVKSHSFLLKILIPNNLFGVGEKIRISMIKACVSVDDIRFLLDFLRQMNRDDNDIKFKLSVRSYNELLMMLARFLMID